MKRLLPILLFSVGQLGCLAVNTEAPFDGGESCPHQDSGTMPPDMTTPPPKCAAAEGLRGDNVLCVDFKDVAALSGLAGWDFITIGGGCWETMSGKLQVKNFSTFMSTCGFTLPSLSTADYGKYSKFTLAVVQSIDLNKMRQTGAIYLSQALDQQQIWLGTGNNPRQQTVLTVAKTALPNGGNNMYQPLFQIASSTQVGLTAMGWQIESIAIQGIQ